MLGFPVPNNIHLEYNRTHYDKFSSTFSMITHSRKNINVVFSDPQCYCYY